MSTDTDDGRNDDGGTTKIDVRVPTAMVDAIDEEFARRGYTSRSEAIRDALRDWLNPSVQLSEETLADLQESWAQREAGET
ncbi:ribbon-helix-helix domain-containing protein, partial [Halorubrum sp. Atlit-28R]